MVYKLFVDTNVYLDYLRHRGKEWEDAQEIFELAERKSLEVFTSASSLLNLMYVMNTYKESRQNIAAHVRAILTYSKLANPDNLTFQSAMGSGFADLEDAVQYYTALAIKGIDYFITSNTKDFKKATAQLPVLTPREFLKRLSK